MSIKGDVLDLTDLQRRGLLKKAQELEKLREQGNNEDYIDLSSNPIGSNAGATPSPLSFLDALASAGASSLANAGVDSTELQELKNKIENIEYKLDRLIEKIAKLEGN